MTHRAFVTAAVLTVSLVVISGARPAAFTASGTQPMSATTVVTWITSTDAEADTEVALLVFWRGRPGWWMKGPNGDASASFINRTTMARARYGDISLSVSFDAESRVAIVAGQKVALASNNVVIVDGIDSSEGGKIVKTVAADGTMENRSFFAMVRRSPVLIGFLQCDVSLPDPKADTMARQICSMLGK